MFDGVSDGAGKQFGRGEHFDFGRLLSEGDRIAHNQFSELRLFDVVVGFTRQHRVGANGPYGACAFFNDGVGRFAQGAGGVHEVVYQDDISSFYFADDGDGADFIGLGSVFIANDQVTVEVFAVQPCPFDAAHVGAGEDGLAQVLIGKVRDVNGFGAQVVHRDVEETLHLIGVQVHGHDAVGTGSGEQVGHQFGADGHPWLVFSVLPGVSEIGDNGGDVACGSAFGGINPQQQFHEVVMWLAGALDKKGVRASHAFVDDGLHFAVAEPRKGFIAERCVIEISNLFGQLLRGGAGKKFYVGHNYRSGLRIGGWNDGKQTVASLRQR